MINNRKAYKIFMGLPKKERKKLQIQYDIESTENLYGHDTPKEIKWLNRFHIRRGGSFGIGCGCVILKQKGKNNENQ